MRPFKHSITAAAIFVAGAWAMGLAAFAAEAPAVTIADGPLAGLTADGADKFLGIPFAAPGGSAYGAKLLPTDPMKAFKSGDFVQVPTLVGFAANEMYGFMHGMYPLSQEGFEAAVKKRFGDKAPDLLTRYATSKYPHNEYAFGAIQGDSLFVCHAFAVADLLAEHVPVSVYQFADMTVPNWKSLGDAQPAPSGYHVGAGHTSELYYLLDYKAIESPLDADQIKLGNAMIGMWVDFGRKKDAAEWPPYKASARNVVDLQWTAAGGIKTVTDAYQAHNCDYWNK